MSLTVFDILCSSYSLINQIFISIGDRLFTLLNNLYSK